MSSNFEQQESQTVTPNMIAGSDTSTATGDKKTNENELLKELSFAKFIVKYPCLLCIITLIILIIISSIDAILFKFTWQGDRTYFPNPPDKYVDAYDGYTLVSDLISVTTEENNTNSITQSKEENDWLYQMFFTLSDYSVGDFDQNDSLLIY